MTILSSVKYSPDLTLLKGTPAPSATPSYHKPLHLPSAFQHATKLFSIPRTYLSTGMILSSASWRYARTALASAVALSSRTVGMLSHRWSNQRAYSASSTSRVSSGYATTHLHGEATVRQVALSDACTQLSTTVRERRHYKGKKHSHCRQKAVEKQ